MTASLWTGLKAALRRAFSFGYGCRFRTTESADPMPQSARPLDPRVETQRMLDSARYLSDVASKVTGLTAAQAQPQTAQTPDEFEQSMRSILGRLQ